MRSGSNVTQKTLERGWWPGCRGTPLISLLLHTRGLGRRFREGHRPLMAAHLERSEHEQHFDENEEEDDEPVDDVSQCSNLIVNYLPPTMSETELRRLFAPHGTIQHVKVVTDRVSGRSMGYGFVRFSTIEEANAAIASKNALQIGTKRIKVRARGSSRSGPPCTPAALSVRLASTAPCIPSAAAARARANAGQHRAAVGYRDQELQTVRRQPAAQLQPARGDGPLQSVRAHHRVPRSDGCEHGPLALQGIRAV